MCSWIEVLQDDSHRPQERCADSHRFLSPSPSAEYATSSSSHTRTVRRRAFHLSSPISLSTTHVTYPSAHVGRQKIKFSRRRGPDDERLCQGCRCSSLRWCSEFLSDNLAHEDAIPERIGVDDNCLVQSY